MSSDILSSFGNFSDVVSAIENDLLDIRESLDMHQFCSYWGAFDAFSYLSDCICLVHGTVGCMASRRFLPVMGSSEPCEFDPQYSTDFDENDVIFGGEKKLESALDKIEDKYSPKLISVITNCCSDIIGDDVGGVISALPDKISSKTVWLHTGGFTGKSYRKGSEEAFKVLVDVMEKAPPRKIKKNTINLFLRRWIWSNNQDQEIEEGVRLLKKIGLEINQVFKKGKTLDEFISLKEAEANIAFCFYFGMTLFEEMNQRFGTKMIKASTPVGLDASLKWLKDVSDKMHIDYDYDNDDEINELKKYRSSLQEKIGKKRIALIWTQTGERMIGMCEIALDLGMVPYVVGLDTAVVRDKIKMFRKEVNRGFNPLVSAVSDVESVRDVAECLDDPIIFCNDDFFPEYKVFRYRYAHNKVYGLTGTKAIYDQMNKCISTKKSKYALTAEVI